MVAIHRLLRPLSDGSLGHVGRELENHAELHPFQAVEITENVSFWAPSARPADADSAANKTRASTVLNHGAEPVVACRAAADFDPQHAELDIELVVDAQNLFERHLEKPHGGLNRFAAQVHVGHGLEEHDVLAGDRNLGEFPFELVAETRRTPAPRQLVDHQEPNIVAIAGVLWPRVP